ncbi:MULTISPECIES: ferrochelatase [Shewanella]|uniref:ferrochelatase n=1 Tax=Shewanella TaxID=22 RepID=UPI00199637A5|nr:MULTISPECIES: ferrochelatase [Shewanella]MCL2907651.1 ferrochelatase [Shewanella fodinae]GGY99740.1 ferrochelatase 1 [Shewanella fodinae]
MTPCSFYQEVAVSHSHPPFGVLLVNLGTPAAPTKDAVRAFLKQFLSDPRVVDLPAWQWQPILQGIILNIRPAKVAKLYQSIWWQEGSPLMVISQRQQLALANQLASRLGFAIPVALGMSYGQPSLADGLDELQRAGVDKVLVLPLYPQYSCSTVASVFDGVAAALKPRRNIPELRMVKDYHDRPGYIAALTESIRKHWQQYGKAEKLLFSFHGVPERYINEGDPYKQHCLTTAALVAQALALPEAEWQVCFQSRFGKEPWLTPYTDETLASLPSKGVKSVDIISPAFAADCLETLEEIAQGGKETFLHAGGEQYHFVPCLNDGEQHMAFLADLVISHAENWR